MHLLRSHKTIRRWMGAVALASLTATGGIVLAQDATTGTQPAAPDAETDAAKKYVSLSDAEISSKTEEMRIELDKAVERVGLIRENERKKRPVDTIKLNCVNEHMVTLSESSAIVTKNAQKIGIYIQARDTATRNDIYADVVIAFDLGIQSAASAEQCIGEDLSYIGDTDVEVEGGNEDDDPTQPQEPDFPEVDFPVCASCFI